jgi:hypothetical protein
MKRRWDPPASVALQNFMNTKYTMAMVNSGVSVIQYFSTKLRLAKEAGFDNVHQQLLAVWNGLDVSIREHIDEPDEDTSIDRFRRALENKERLWREKLIQQRLRGQGPARWSANQRFPPQGASAPPFSGVGGPVQSSERTFLPSNQYQRGFQNNRFSSQNFSNRNRPEPARIGQPPQRLQITAGPPTSAETSPRRPTSWSPGRRACSKCGGQHMDWEHAYFQNPSGSRPTKTFYLETLQHGMSDYSQDDVAECIAAYHAADDGDSSPLSSPKSPGTPRAPSPGTPRGLGVDYMGESGYDMRSSDYHSVGGSSWFEQTDEYQDAYDVHYHHLAGEVCGSTGSSSSVTFSSPVFTLPTPKVPVQVTATVDSQSVQFSCRFSSCDATFPSRNQLHKHLHDTAHFAAEASANLSSPGARVVKPTKRPSLGSGYAFRGFRYAEVQIRPSVDGEDQWVCADSGCGMSVVDDIWFRRTFPGAHVATMPVPVRIKGIASDAHISDRYSVVTVAWTKRRRICVSGNRAGTTPSSGTGLSRSHWGGHVEALWDVSRFCLVSLANPVLRCRGRDSHEVFGESNSE